MVTTEPEKDERKVSSSQVSSSSFVEKYGQKQSTPSVEYEQPQTNDTAPFVEKYGQKQSKPDNVEYVSGSPSSSGSSQDKSEPEPAPFVEKYGQKQSTPENVDTESRSVKQRLKSWADNTMRKTRQLQGKLERQRIQKNTPRPAKPPFAGERRQYPSDFYSPAPGAPKRTTAKRRPDLPEQLQPTAPRSTIRSQRSADYYSRMRGASQEQRQQADDYYMDFQAKKKISQARQAGEPVKAGFEWVKANPEKTAAGVGAGLAIGSGFGVVPAAIEATYATGMTGFYLGKSGGEFASDPSLQTAGELGKEVGLGAATYFGLRSLGQGARTAREAYRSRRFANQIKRSDDFITDPEWTWVTPKTRTTYRPVPGRSSKTIETVKTQQKPTGYDVQDNIYNPRPAERQTALAPGGRDMVPQQQAYVPSMRADPAAAMGQMKFPRVEYYTKPKADVQFSYVRKPATTRQKALTEGFEQTYKTELGDVRVQRPLEWDDYVSPAPDYRYRGSPLWRSKKAQVGRFKQRFKPTAPKNVAGDRGYRSYKSGGAATKAKEFLERQSNRLKRLPVGFVPTPIDKAKSLLQQQQASAQRPAQFTDQTTKPIIDEKPGQNQSQKPSQDVQFLKGSPQRPRQQTAFAPSTPTRTTPKPPTTISPKRPVPSKGRAATPMNIDLKKKKTQPGFVWSYMEGGKKRGSNRATSFSRAVRQGMDRVATGPATSFKVFRKGSVPRMPPTSLPKRNQFKQSGNQFTEKKRYRKDSPRERVPGALRL